MLLRHSAIYFLARGVPGLINFLALAVYTRLLAPEQYGYYALAIAVVAFINAVVWQWLRLGLLRFLAGYEERREAFLSTLAAAFVSLIIVSACAFGLAIVIWSNEIWLGFSWLSLVLLWSQAWFELNLELARSSMSPVLYGGLASVKAVIAIVLGAWLAYLGYGVEGVLIGLFIGFALPALWMTWRAWRVVRVHLVDREILSELARYGIPLTATFALNYIFYASDRFLIGWYMGPAYTGFYAAGYDLAAQTLAVVMSIVNLAAYPLVVRALEKKGADAARLQLRVSATLMLIVALPITAVFVLLANNIASVVLDAAYAAPAASILPIITVATLAFGFQSFYFALAFQLGKQTVLQIWVVLAAAMVNVMLNLVWIPAFGLIGAAYATLVAQGAALTMSWLLGRRVFELPMPNHVLKITMAAGLMVMAIWPMIEWRGAAALAAQVMVGATAYAAALYLLDVDGIQHKIALRVEALRR